MPTETKKPTPVPTPDPPTDPYALWRAAEKQRRIAADAYALARAQLEAAEATASRLRRQATEAALADPKVGDLLHEMGASLLLVTERKGDRVGCCHAPWPCKLPDEGKPWSGTIAEFGKAWSAMMLSERKE